MIHDLKINKFKNIKNKYKTIFSVLTLFNYPYNNI